MTEKLLGRCANCDSEFTISWHIEQTDLQPYTCPFCGHEVDYEELDEEDYNSWD
jgi:DNA-directed RNA polymerase subunit RPC12/RpoP